MKKIVQLVLVSILLLHVSARADSTSRIDSVSSKKTEFIDKIPISSLESLLQGRFAGLNVQNVTGTPGEQQIFSIRNVGLNSMKSLPLVILNGVPIFQEASPITRTNPLSSILVDDISSIEIIKDASALALYGSRAANGLILITTKQSNTASQVVFNLSSGVSASGDVYRDVYGGNKELTQVRSLYDKRNLLYPNQKVDYPFFGSDPNNSFFRENNWQKDLYNMGKYMNYNFGISGSGVFGFYNICLGYLNEDGIAKDSKFSRYNLSINSRYNVTEKFGFDFYISGSQIKRNQGMSQLLPPSYGPFTSDPVFPENVFVADNAKLDDNVNNHIYSNAKAFYNLNANWALSTTLGLVYENYRRDYFLPSTLNEGIISSFAASSQSQRFISRSEIDYNGKLNDRKLTAKLGFEMIQSQQELIYISGNRSGSAFSDFVKVVTGYATNEIVGGTDLQKNILASGYGTVNYQVSNNLNVQGTVRADGSSQYSTDNRWKIFPGLGINWTFIKDNKGFVRNASLKGGGALLGIANDSGTLYAGSIESIGNYGTYEAPVTVLAYNKGLTYPTSKQFDLNLDIQLGNSLELNVAGYTKAITDYMMIVPTPQYTGHRFVIENGMDVDVSGLELTINFNKQFGDLNWNSTVIANSVKSKIKRLNPDSMTELREGESLSSIYAYQSIGKLETVPVNSKTGQVSTFEGVPFQIGVPHIADQNADGSINKMDQMKIAENQPKWTGGWNNQLNYKHFYLDAQVNFFIGAQIVQESYSERYSDDSYRHSLYADNGELTPYYFLRKNASGGIQIQGISSINDVSSFRLSNLTLGYSFHPKDFLKIKNLDIYGTATNLLTLSNYGGINPEENYNGISQFDLSSTGTPLYSTLVLGVKVKF